MIKIHGLFKIMESYEKQEGLKIVKRNFNHSQKYGIELGIPLIENCGDDKLIKKILLNISFCLVDTNIEDQQRYCISGYRLAYVPEGTELGTVKNSFKIIAKPYSDMERLLMSDTFLIKDIDGTKQFTKEISIDQKYNYGDQVYLLLYSDSQNKHVLAVYNVEVSFK